MPDLDRVHDGLEKPSVRFKRRAVLVLDRSTHFILGCGSNDFHASDKCTSNIDRPWLNIQWKNRIDRVLRHDVEHSRTLLEP